MQVTKRRLALAAAALAAVALAVLAFLPKPLVVETGAVTRAPLRVTVDEIGETRARDRYTLAAPTPGRLERVRLRAGDAVERGQVVAVLHLAPLDPREREAAQARVRAAEALRREAEEVAARAETDLAQALRDRDRAGQLEAKGLVARQDFEQARSAAEAARQSLEAARFRARAAASAVAVARAALLAEPGSDAEARLLELRAPESGRVLRVLEESERVVPAGTPILVVGDAARLEVVIETLTTDAVRVRPGMPVLLENWGGGTLRAVVRLVEPAAFTKVSALGIEEQRVNVVADLGEAAGPLGDGYRVEARIVVWEAEAALQAPASAIFRHGEGWAAFTVAASRARLRPVEVGHRTAAAVEILGGLAEGDAVVLHPPNELADGLRVRVR